LLFLVNLGCIDINVWNSRVPSLDSPDYMVLDFDPLDVPFERVVEAVLQTHDVLENIEAEHFVKTSGATGLHVYVPLGAAYTFEQAEEFAQLVAALVNELLPDITSIVRAPARREKKVYLDYLQNRKAQTMAAPYCVRPRKGAPVSTPLRWDEVNKRLDPRSFTMRNAPERLDRIGDLWRQAFSKGIDMPHCLDRLEKLYRMPVEKRRETVKA
jgi:bifunctional non-homologous end joining protein LigD